jgi:hypothetical protein
LASWFENRPIVTIPILDGLTKEPVPTGRGPITGIVGMVAVVHGNFKFHCFANNSRLSLSLFLSLSPLKPVCGESDTPVTMSHPSSGLKRPWPTSRLAVTFHFRAKPDTGRR